MSTESDLPAELIEIQQRLNQTLLPAGAIDRDELLYQAGWAAAEAQLARQRGGGIVRLLWPISTAAMAASVLFLLLTGPERSEVAVLSSDDGVELVVELGPSATTEVPTESSGEVATEKPGAGTPRLAYSPLRRPFFIGRGSVDPFMFSMRNDDLYREPFDDFEPSTPSKTSRELLQEMLPELNRRTELEDTPKRFWFRTLRRAFS